MSGKIDHNSCYLASCTVGAVHGYYELQGTWVLLFVIYLSPPRTGADP